MSDEQGIQSVTVTARFRVPRHLLRELWPQITTEDDEYYARLRAEVVGEALVLGAIATATNVNELHDEVLHMMEGVHAASTRYRENGNNKDKGRVHADCKYGRTGYHGY